VTFRVIALLDEINAAETACAAKLKSWRMRGRAGRLNEWLSGISPDEVQRVVVGTLTTSEFDFKHLT